jgi:Sulfotransferase domain
MVLLGSAMTIPFPGSQRPKLLVVSHERSGTHFLMNSIAKSFGYIANPWVNFDNTTLQINFHADGDVEQFFGQFRGRFPTNIFKSHHPFAFFENSLHSFIDEFHILYIYRDPRDVMVSLWHYLNKLPWHEGPKSASPKELIRAQPSGQMLRYQYFQEPSLIHRWRSHVDGWTLRVPERYRSRITLVGFRDLATNYEQAIRSIGPVLGEPVSFEKPTLDDSSVLPHQGVVGSHKSYFDAEDLKLFRDIAGPTMDRLGIDDSNPPSSAIGNGQLAFSLGRDLVSH